MVWGLYLTWTFFFIVGSKQQQAAASAPACGALPLKFPRPLGLSVIGRASLGRIFQDSDWLRDGPMRRIGPPWGIFGQESLQIPPAERSPGSTLGLGPLLDIQTFGGRRRRQFEPRYARVEPPPAPTASGPISNIGPRPRADPRSLPLTTHHTRVRQRCDCSRVP